MENSKQAWALTETVLLFGANPHQIDDNGQTPLFYVARDGKCGILDFFLR